MMECDARHPDFISLKGAWPASAAKTWIPAK
jgi:hypothetical protein